MEFRPLFARFVLLLVAILLAGIGGCAGDDDDSTSDSAVDDDGADDDATADDDADDDAGDDDTWPPLPDDDEPERPDYPNDDVLRVNMIQAKGSHNSYHIQQGAITIPEYRYTHFPLDQELDAGVRQVELDVHYKEDGIRVFHVPIIDRQTTCELFTDCLAIIKNWSDAHPGHHPLMIFVEPKDDIDFVKWPGLHGEIENEVLSVWPEERIVTPDEVRGDAATLRDAILTDGWPTLGETRDRVLFHLNAGGSFRDEYLADYPGLEGALMFIDSEPADDHAAVIVKNDPETDAAAILDAAAAGFVIRSRADSCCDEAINEDYTRFDLALDSGAHYISTDFPILGDEYNYVIDIPGGTPSRCNPITAPDFCQSSDIEALIR
ncbi:MAG: hypothetical protein KJ042_11175 [Deltaproteobacteria bacterium]|nr:hypothetical protein [Deltaproteobacteria bacterium]